MARTFPDETAVRLAELCGRFIRPPVGFATDDVTGLPIIDFEPPMTAAEQTVYANLLALAKSAAALTPAQFDLARPQLQALRLFRQTFTQNSYVNATEAVRNRADYDFNIAVARLLLTLYRADPLD